MVRKICNVAKREFGETVKTKTFLLSLFFTPVLVGLIILFTGSIQKKMEGPRPAKRLIVLDLSRELSHELSEMVEQHNRSNPGREIILTLSEEEEIDDKTLSQKMQNGVLRKNVDGYLIIARDVVEGKGKSRFYSRMNKVSDMEFNGTVHSLLNRSVRNTRFQLHGLSPQVIADLGRGVAVEQVDVASKKGKGREATLMLMLPFFFLFMMFTGVFSMNQQLLTTVIEEKNSRVVEVLLSALSPFELMAGKILGLAAVGLTVMGIWGIAACLAASYKGVLDVLNMANVGYFIIYYILGFLFFSSLFAAIGSACNTLKEAQNLIGPITILLIIPLIGWFYFAQHPESTLATVLSFIPPLTPMMMILRIAAFPEIPFVQIFASILLLAASVPVVMWMSAKIFRIGILMYGKSPTPLELLRWIRFR